MKTRLAATGRLSHCPNTRGPYSNAKNAAGQLTPDQHSAALKGFWMAFAKFGMGGARTNGPNLSGIVADFNAPALV